ncbi:MAG: purine-binding chemotaxis protein CheW [Armatimonadetes bacterium]|nr:purine-binding chemotaxis protein CheW [Armatimonadota bacterium]
MTKAAEAGAASEQQLVLFRVSKEVYGIDIHKVQRLLPIPPITKIPGAPDFVEGVTEVRGEVVPVVNMRKRMGYQDTEWSDEARVIIVELDGYDAHLGLIVDGVSEVFKLPMSEIEPVSEAAVKFRDPLVTGIGKDGERLIVLIDPNYILGAEQVAGMESAIAGTVGAVVDRAA